MSTRVDPTERLLNLVIALRNTRVPLTKAEIRHRVVGYQDSPNEAAFERMFERDKDALRGLGIPVEARVGAVHEDEHGYLLRWDEVDVPLVSLSPAQLSVLQLAGRIWDSPELQGIVRQGLDKVSALTERVDPESITDVTIQQSSPPALLALLEAVNLRQRVSFTYRTAYSGRLEKRTVEPHRLYSAGGAWYLAAHDLGRDAPRTFRLTRIIGRVRSTGGHGAFEAQPRPELEQPPVELATLEVRSGRGWELRAMAQTITNGKEWDRLGITYHDIQWFASQVAAAGESVRVVEPAPLRDLVTERWKSVAVVGSASTIGAVSESADGADEGDHHV